MRTFHLFVSTTSAAHFEVKAAYIRVNGQGMLMFFDKKTRIIQAHNKDAWASVIEKTE